MNIAFLGTGLMGSAMAERVASSKLKVIKSGTDVGINQIGVYNRSVEKTQKLKELGAAIYTDPVEAIKSSEVVIIMLSEYSAINEVLFKNSYSDFSGKTVIMMSTIASEESKALEEKIKSFGGIYLEAPVLGSTPQAKEGSLFILVGGDKELAEKYESLFEIMGEYNYLGKVGNASSIKLALNQMIATETAAISMSLGYLLNKGIDINPFMNILRKSALYAPTFDKKLNNYLDDNYENPNFPLKHMLKDIKLIENDFGKASVNTAVLKSMIELISSGVEKGFGDNDYSAMFKTFNPDQK